MSYYPNEHPYFLFALQIDCADLQIACQFEYWLEQPTHQTALSNCFGYSRRREAPTSPVPLPKVSRSATASSSLVGAPQPQYMAAGSLLFFSWGQAVVPGPPSLTTVLQQEESRWWLPAPFCPGGGVNEVGFCSFGKWVVRRVGIATSNGGQGRQTLLHCTLGKLERGEVQHCLITSTHQLPATVLSQWLQWGLLPGKSTQDCSLTFPFFSRQIAQSKGWGFFHKDDYDPLNTFY